MISLMLGDLILESLTSSVNAPLEEFHCVLGRHLLSTRIPPRNKDTSNTLLQNGREMLVGVTCNFPPILILEE
jgi:hypothetical protein